MNPAGAQVYWNEIVGVIGDVNNALGNLHQGIGRIVPELPNIEAAVNAQIVDRLVAIENAVTAIQNRMDREFNLQAIRITNRHSPSSAPVHYPEGTPQVALDTLPRLKRDAVRINGAEAAIALGLLGQPVPNATTPADVKVRQFQEFIGVYD